MITGQTSIFEMLYPTFKIDKPIRTIELFGGYGSQLLALKYLGANVEQWKLCEWAIKSIQAYKDLHFEEDNFDYSINLSLEEVKEYLFKKGISSNYNEPMTQQQISRLNEKQARTIYNNIKATHNLVNIQQVKGNDLEIIDIDKYIYMMTYSFPCQDLSSAGKGEGMSDTSTRSGLLWEVERILNELEEKPQILLMENVPQVHGADNVEDFNKWQLRLEEIGYKNYWQDIIATDYGIPQTRNRCFMVSILGDYNYTFPKPIPLKLKLKDMLEDNVDEKYYLSDKMINCFMSDTKMGDITRKDRFLQNLNRENQEIANSITTLNGSRVTDTFILNKHLRETLEQNKKKIKDGSYIDAYNKTIRDDDLSSTITTRVSDSNDTYIITNMKIRKLTPRECFRLMGVKDKDYDKIAENQSDSSLYHLAGDSIVVDVLMSIFGEMLGDIGEYLKNEDIK